MSVIFSDGFDHYTTAIQKWTSGNGTISSTFGRNGNGIAPNTGLNKQVAASQEHATMTVGCAIKRGGGSGQVLIVFLSDSGVTTHLTIRVTGTGEIQAFRGTTAGTQLGSTVSAGTIPESVWKYIEVKAVLHDTTGSVEIRVDGNSTPVLSVTNQDTKNGGTKTVFDTVQLTFAVSSPNFDDVYVTNGAGSVNTGFLGDVKIETLFANGAGTTTGLTPSTGSNFQTVDETAPNTTDYSGSATNDLYDTYAFGNLATAAGTIFAVNIYAYAAKSDAGAKGGAIMIRSGGTDYEKTDNALATGFQYYNDIVETDPATSTAWTISNVNAAEFGWKVKAS